MHIILTHGLIYFGDVLTVIFNIHFQHNLFLNLKLLLLLSVNNIPSTLGLISYLVARSLGFELFFHRIFFSSENGGVK